MVFVIERLWWFLLVAAVGAVVGSFLNAVIYRLPRDISLFRPRGSFCPHCRAAVRWYDNIPLISYLLLRGRCRHCGTGISPRYPAVEALTCLGFVLIFDAMIVSGVRVDLTPPVAGTLSDHVLRALPVLGAYWALLACLIVIATIDLETYWVDTRITNLLAAIGFVYHIVRPWPAVPPDPVLAPPPPLAGACVAGALATAGAFVLSLRRGSSEIASGTEATSSPAADEGLGDVAHHPDSSAPDGPLAADAPGSTALTRAAGGAVALLALLALAAWGTVIARDGYWTADLRAFAWRAGAVAAFAFVTLALGAGRVREADRQMAATLDAERPHARRMVLLELLRISPAIVAAALVWGLLSADMPLAAWWRQTLATPQGSVFGWLWHGLAAASVGLFGAAAVGWAVRIGFTLLLGREAFGVGDIHIMAACGAVAGFTVVIIGFFLAAALGLAGWLLALVSKRSTALPFGPWLALGIVIAAIAADPLYRRLAETITAWRTLLG